ncbi:SDR family oxidoreductase [Niveispirillum sp.]|uniref:SDR family NAD(P)-dependent oxidoreductase n=1 Tax=Niveispirillum sp. TaxID=1917217 RepID=UPI001B42BE44|nr:SDR family oxidoreductase [Niveispirillum sp.]MBP7337098.1 SDR family oxidoreductase [Niveispirillum sp.]
MRPLQGEVAIITGAGRGIGRAIALKLAGAGASVIVNDLDEGPAVEVVAAIRAAGGQAEACAGDVLAPGFAERFVALAVERFGDLTIIVNNAGYTWDNVIQKTADEQWEAMIGIHLTAPFRVLRAARPVIGAAVKAERAAGRPPRRRSVVNISSIAGLGGNPGQVGYAAGKAGVIGLTKTLAKEWGRYNVTVNAVAFGVILTRLTDAEQSGGSIDMAGRAIKVGISAELRSAAENAIPLGRAGTPEDAAGAVYLLCLPEAGYISGQVLTCGGGYTL